MNIRHECPMPDLSFAVTAPLRLQPADGPEVTVTKWNLSGLWLDEAAQDPGGEPVLIIPFQGVDVSFPVQLAPAPEAGHYAFSSLTVRQRETLAAFYQGVMTGRMATTGEMITSLDTPLDLVPMGETAEEEAAGRAKEKPRLLRVLWNVLSYVLLAAVLAGFLGGQVWRRLTEVQLDNARFTAALSGYTAPESGFLKRLNVAEGDQVQAGHILARIEDPDREGDVEAARADVQAAERRLKRAIARRDQHLALRFAQRAELWAAFQREWLPWRAHDARAQRYPPRLQEAFDRLYAFDRGRDLAAGGFFGILQTLEDAVEDSEQDLRRWKRQLRHRKSAANGLVVRARAAGTVYAVHAVPGGHVARNSLILEVEANSPRTASGWLDDGMAGQVHIGMPATIRFSYRGKSRRVAGTVAAVEAGADAGRPGRYGMIVTVKADGTGPINARKWFRHNAPAEVTLDRSHSLRFWEGEADAGS